MIEAPQFWTRNGLASRLLRPVSWIYGAIAGARMRGPARYRPSIPVIAIGNFTAGGAGKTPTAIAITRMATELGFSPIVLIRGYGGSVRRPVLVDANHDTSRDVGDEALMIARAGVPVIASRDRAAGADLAISCGCDLLILDDGFQSPALAKDLSLVVVDSVYGVGNGEVIPAGPLRVPLNRQFAATDALIVISNGEIGDTAKPLADRARLAGKPVFTARIEPDERTTGFSGLHVVAFAGIGRPAKLTEGLRARGALIDELISFPDHHRFTPKEARALLARVAGTDRVLVTTAKDMARLAGDPDPALNALAGKAKVAEVRLAFDDNAHVSAFLADSLGRLGASPRSKPVPAATQEPDRPVTQATAQEFGA